MRSKAQKSSQKNYKREKVKTSLSEAEMTELKQFLWDGSVDRLVKEVMDLYATRNVPKSEEALRAITERIRNTSEKEQRALWLTIRLYQKAERMAFPASCCFLTLD